MRSNYWIDQPEIREKLSILLVISSNIQAHFGKFVRGLGKGETADFVLPRFSGFPMYSRARWEWWIPERIPGVRWESQEYEGNSDISIVLLAFPSYSQDSHRTLGISIVLPGFLPYSQDFHRTPGIFWIFIVLPEIPNPRNRRFPLGIGPYTKNKTYCSSKIISAVKNIRPKLFQDIFERILQMKSLAKD